MFSVAVGQWREGDVGVSTIVRSGVLSGTSDGPIVARANENSMLLLSGLPGEVRQPICSQDHAVPRRVNSFHALP